MTTPRLARFSLYFGVGMMAACTGTTKDASDTDKADATDAADTDTVGTTGDTDTTTGGAGLPAGSVGPDSCVPEAPTTTGCEAPTHSYMCNTLLSADPPQPSGCVEAPNAPPIGKYWCCPDALCFPMFGSNYRCANNEAPPNYYYCDPAVPAPAGCESIGGGEMCCP